MCANIDRNRSNSLTITRINQIILQIVAYNKLNQTNTFYSYNLQMGNFGLNKQDRDIPTKEFLDQVFNNLKKDRLNFIYPEIKFGSHFKEYKTIPIQKLDQRKRNTSSQSVDGKYLWKNGLVKTIYCYEESCPLTEKHQNGFFKAFYQAYINHGDIKIIPDDVWMAIMLFFSKYVYQHAQQLRSAFVTHEGKKELTVETDTNQYEWDDFFNQMIAQIKKKTVDNVTQNLQNDFSTTNRFFTIFSTAIIMNSYQNYFKYTNYYGVCGIQNIHMGGSKQDWAKLISKLSYLQQFDVNGQLKLYVTRLKPVLQQFLQTYRGNASLKFWNNIYHERKEPDKNDYIPIMHINGWIIRFFTTQQQLSNKIKIEQIDVPIKVVDKLTGITKTMHLVGGCRGISIEKNVFRPHFSFAIVQKTINNQYWILR